MEPMRTAEPHGGRMAFVDDVLAEVRAELLRAYTKFPRATVSVHEGYAVLLEEVDELWDEVKANRSDLQRKEAVQVAAMGVRFIVDLFLARVSPDASGNVHPEGERRQGAAGVGKAVTPDLSVASDRSSRQDTGR